MFLDIERKSDNPYKSLKLNVINSEFLFSLGTLSFNNCGIDIIKIVKSTAIETPLEEKVAVLLSRQRDSMLSSKTLPKRNASSRRSAKAFDIFTYCSTLEDSDKHECQALDYSKGEHCIATSSKAWIGESPQLDVSARKP